MSAPRLCQCGCGEATDLAPRTDAAKGWVKGQPLRYRRYHRPPPIRRGAQNHRFNGGLSQFQGRTIIVHRDGKWSFYYRVLMEMRLGRALRSEEVVHHINGDVSDDRIGNLAVLTRAEHLAVHRTGILAAKRAADVQRKGATA